MVTSLEGQKIEAEQRILVRVPVPEENWSSRRKAGQKPEASMVRVDHMDGDPWNT